MERHRDDQFEIESPPCDAPYLLDYLWEVGPTQPSGTGSAPISHLEISAWQANTGVELSAWEARTLRRLSSAFLAEFNAASDRNRRAPWPPEPTEEMRVSIAAKLRDVLRD